MFEPIVNKITAEDVKNRLLAYSSLKAAQEEIDNNCWYGNITTYTLCLRLSGIYGEKQFDDVMTGGIDETLNIGKYPYLENAIFLRETSHLDDVNFVQQLYQAFLAREADAGGLEGNVNQLQNGAPRENLVIGLRNSGEADNVFLRVTECLDNRHFLEIAYRVYLKLENRSLRWEQDLQALENGVLREQVFQELKHFQQIQTALQQREGDFNRPDSVFLSNTQTMSDEDFVKELYLTYCKREADPGGLEGNVNQLQNGVTRADLLFGLRTSEEAANVFVDLTAGLDLPTFIQVAYIAYRQEELTPIQQQKCLEILESGSIRQTILRGDLSKPVATPELTPEPVVTEPVAALIEEKVEKSIDEEVQEPEPTKSSLELVQEQLASNFALSNKKFLAQTANLNNQEFIQRLYQTYLQRPADSDGLEANVNQLERGELRAKVLYMLRISSEAANVFQKITNDLSDRDYLDYAYLYFRKQSLTPEKRASKLKNLQSGADRKLILQNCPSFDFIDLEEEDVVVPIAKTPQETTNQDSLEQLLADLKIEDKDFLAQRENLKDAEFIQEVYQIFFRRPADSAGLNSNLEQLTQGVSRWEILYDLRTSPEAANIFLEHTSKLDNSEFLDVAYEAYLKRNLDPENKAAYLQYLDEGNPRDTILS